MVLSASAAWSQNPKNPPFFLDLPTEAGKLREDIAANWVAHAPLAEIDQYIANLRK
jgi:hypothetical protein